MSYDDVETSESHVSRVPTRMLKAALPEDYPGHPLRKDFKVPEFYNGMKVPY